MEQRLGRGLLVLAITIALIWVISPFYWAIICSLKQPKDILTRTYIPFLQFQPTLAHWIRILTMKGPEVFRGLRNSLIVAASASLLALLLGTLAGYALARCRLRKVQNKDLIMFLIAQRILPPVVVVIPFFIIMKSLHLLDSLLALVLINATFTLPFSTLIMRSAFKEIPVQLEEAALVDGASRLGVLWRVALPLARSGLIASVLICFAFTWNDFIFALTLSYSNAVTLPLITAGSVHTRGVEFWNVAVGLLITIVCPLIILMSLQRFLVRGLTLGAVKE